MTTLLKCPDCRRSAEYTEHDIHHDMGYDFVMCPWCDHEFPLPAGCVASIYDPDGAYSPDGDYLGRAHGRCEDAPCCGCCP